MRCVSWRPRNSHREELLPGSLMQRPQVFRVFHEATRIHASCLATLEYFHRVEDFPQRGFAGNPVLFGQDRLGHYSSSRNVSKIVSDPPAPSGIAYHALVTRSPPWSRVNSSRFWLANSSLNPPTELETFCIVETETF